MQKIDNNTTASISSMPFTTTSTISTTIITQANNSMQKNKSFAYSMQDINNINRDIDVSMLIMLENTVNFEKDKNNYALSKSNHKNSNNYSNEIKSYVTVTTTPSFIIFTKNERIMSKTESTTPVTTISNTIKSSLLEIILKELFKNKENNNNEYFLLDKTTPLDLIKSSFTTPKALASAKNLYNIKKNGELSAIYNTIISNDDALTHNNNNNNNYGGKRGENAYSIIDISENVLYSTSVAPKSTSIIPTTTSSISMDTDLIIIDDDSATDIISTIATDVEKNTTNEVSTTSAAIVTFALTTSNTVINISASAQLKNNDRYEIPLTIQFAPNYKLGKKYKTMLEFVEFRWELLYLFSRI
jgi:hypothetical protein